MAGIAPLAAWDDLEFARDWVERGYGGEMEYLKNPKRTDARILLPSAQSVVCAGLVYNAARPYSTEVNNSASSSDGARGWISRYAWGTDYHKIVRSRLEQLRTAIEDLAPGVETRAYVDTGPIVERAFARLSGIGWIGKNTCLINQDKGSWFFLGVILTSLELDPDLPAFDRCGSCRRCIDACPTGALVEPYVMDASRCIAYFNIELKSAIPVRFRSALGTNVFGCDICQDVCPWNARPSSMVGERRPAVSDPPQTKVTHANRRHAATTRVAEFQPMEVHGFSLFNPRLEDLASLTEEDFRRLFRRSPVKRVKYRGWLRNVCVAMGNSGDPRFVPRLESLREHAMVREHADWALHKIQTETGGSRAELDDSR